MSKKTRDHKTALRRRAVRIATAKALAKEKMWKSVVEEYAEGSDVMPMPTLVDALSTRDFDKIGSVQVGKKALIDYFGSYIIEGSKKYKIGIDLPEYVISYIIPLDFYIPLPGPYNAMSISTSDAHINSAVCITIVSSISKIEDSAIKTSYLIGSICSKEFEYNNKFSNDLLFGSFERIVKDCNNVIAGFQTIPTRHNHYMHKITAQSCPSQVDVFIFSRLNKNEVFNEIVGINGNVKSEIFQARSLDDIEIGQFRVSHVNKTFTDDKIFSLISKYNEATNTRCFGNNEESIVLVDNFSELAMGYLYCEARVVSGDNRKIVISEYTTMKTTSDLIGGFALLLGVTKKKFKKDIGFDDWYKHCRNARNDLTHRFMTNPPSPDESLNALHHAGSMIGKLCVLLSNKFSSGSYIEFQDKLSLLRSVSYFVDVLHYGNTNKN